MTEPINLDIVPLEALSPAALKFAGPTVPPGAKMMAARGLAPLPPKDMLATLAALVGDSAEAVASAARTTLAGLPERILDGALSDKLPQSVVHVLAKQLHGTARWVERLVLNPDIHDETVQFLASKAEERQLEIIAQNEMRLMRAPRIIEALYMNPRTRMSTVDRLMEFAVRGGLDLSGIPAFKEAQAAILGLRALPPEPEEEQAVEEAQPEPTEPAEPASTQAAQTPPTAAPFSGRAIAGQTVWGGRAPVTPGAPGSPVSAVPAEPVMLTPVDAPTDLPSDLIAAMTEENTGEDDALGQEDKKGNIQAQLVKMTASQKVRFAQIGNKEVRGYLMRDSNKMVASAAIKNPRVTEQEIITVANSRSVNDEVIRVISATREWTKAYQVRFNLVNNPKCPLPVALRFLRTLRASDVKTLAKNKNVSGAVSTAARRLTSNEKGG